MTIPRRIALDEWDRRYENLVAGGLREPWYGGSLRRHVDDGDLRLRDLLYDNSPAALRLWNFLLSEEDRLADARRGGQILVGAMKDLGTVPVLAYSYPNVKAFYPDGAWWIPCVMRLSDGLLGIADALGVGDTFCPVRAMLGAFVSGAHFPLPDLLTCSVGATCDDFSAIAQRLQGLGHPILWWEAPHRRAPDPDEAIVDLPGGLRAPRAQVDFLVEEFARVRQAMDTLTGHALRDEELADGIRQANAARDLLRKLRETVFTAQRAPLPALEMLIAEMLIIHFCSDRDETMQVLQALLAETEDRVAQHLGVLPEDAVRICWINPVADLRVMNLLEACGGRLCGSEFLFSHALDPIPVDCPPLEGLARAALADPMIGPLADRADRIVRDAKTFGAEAIVVSRIPGGSHCAFEGGAIRRALEGRLDIPVLEIEIPPIADAVEAGLRTRLEALVETVRTR